MFPDTISTFAPRIRHPTGPEPGLRKEVQLQWPVQANAGRFRLLCFVSLLPCLQRRITVALSQSSSRVGRCVSKPVRLLRRRGRLERQLLQCLRRADGLYRLTEKLLETGS
jgi:hypothetical protein